MEEFTLDPTKEFRTRCTLVNNKICNVIINQGLPNWASPELVEKLRLPFTAHPQPYWIRGLHGDEDFYVSKWVQVFFSIGRIYYDSVFCDVVDMDICHLLLGKDWCTQRKTQFRDGHQVCSVINNEKKISLKGLNYESVTKREAADKISAWKYIQVFQSSVDKGNEDENFYSSELKFLPIDLQEEAADRKQKQTLEAQQKSTLDNLGASFLAVVDRSPQRALKTREQQDQIGTTVEPKHVPQILKVESGKSNFGFNLIVKGPCASNHISQTPDLDQRSSKLFMGQSKSVHIGTTHVFSNQLLQRCQNFESIVWNESQQHLPLSSSKIDWLIEEKLPTDSTFPEDKEIEDSILKDGFYRFYHINDD